MTIHNSINAYNYPPTKVSQVEKRISLSISVLHQQHCITDITQKYLRDLFHQTTIRVHKLLLHRSFLLYLLHVSVAADHLQRKHFSALREIYNVFPCVLQTVIFDEMYLAKYTFFFCKRL